MKNLRVAVDIGGTFTDICILDQNTGEVRITKTPSTSDPIDGVLNGLEAANVNLRDVVLLSHGTTVATNALITRRLPRTAMVCTRGFRDVIEIRRANKDDLWDIYKDVAPPYVKRRDRLDVIERIDAAGRVLEPLNEANARDVARILKKRGVKAVAVCFINAYINPDNERRMKQILVEEMPDIPISTSSETLPEIFEHERFSTTVVNAALSPVLTNYTDRLSRSLSRKGYESDLLLLHTGGGVMTANSVKDFAGRLAGSGIAAGAIASRHIALQAGFPNSIGLDMGGTSTDVSLVYNGESRVTKDWWIEFGYPIRFPSIEVLTIGAGGGSLAWIDEAGGLRNGPQSAGANPGPACYSRGNKVPTNTDANLALGRLGEGLVGGGMRLSSSLAKQAVQEGVAEPLRMGLEEAANAIIRVANANMADAVRLISISRGYDPRDFALVAFGGAGALHGAEIARELSIPTVIIPPYPGITSAIGCLLVDVQHDLSESYLRSASEANPDDIEAAFGRLEREGRSRLTHENVEPDNIILQRTIDMMYQGQWRSLAVPVGFPVGSLEQLSDAFHRQHAQEYNFRRDDTPVSVFRLNLRAIGLVPKAEFSSHEIVTGDIIPRSHRSVCFENTGAVNTPIYWRPEIGVGSRISGPAIIEQFDSTTVVPPSFVAEVDQWLNIILRLEDF